MSVAWDNSTYLWLAQVDDPIKLSSMIAMTIRVFFLTIIVIAIVIVVITVLVLINIIIITDCGDGLFSKQQLSVSGKTCLMADKLGTGAGRTYPGRQMAKAMEHPIWAWNNRT